MSANFPSCQDCTYLSTVSCSPVIDVVVVAVGAATVGDGAVAVGLVAGIGVGAGWVAAGALVGAAGTAVAVGGVACAPSPRRPHAAASGTTQIITTSKARRSLPGSTKLMCTPSRHSMVREGTYVNQSGENERIQQW